MDVVISSGWRSSTSNFTVETFDENSTRTPIKPQRDCYISKHGRYEIKLSADGDGWIVEFTSTGRLFGPRVEIYKERHTVSRHAAWDVMCRVIRATGDEQAGITAGRQAAHWLQDRQSVC